MTAKSKQSATPATPEDDGRAKRMVTISLAPAYNGAAIMEKFTGNTFGKVDPMAAADELKRQCSAVHGGDLRRVESMLTSQAHSLDVLFASLARRGGDQDGLKQYETHMKLALKAQSQCRATLETLATIKNPPAVFAKQANISHGPQQVNNDSTGIARVDEIEKPQTELLEHDHGGRLDTGTAAATSGSYQAMETVEAIHRPAQQRRKGHGQP